MNFVKHILIYSGISAIVLLHPSLNKGNNFITKLQHYVYGNSFFMNVNPDINTTNLKVLWVGIEKNKEIKKLLIYLNGKEINNIPPALGQEQLIVYYNNHIVGKINHTVTAQDQSHQYNLSISSKNGAIFFKGEINGPSPMISPATTTLPLASL